MVSHGTAKKRRRGGKVSRKPLRNKTAAIARKVSNAQVKVFYDKSKTPKENLLSLGLASNVNNIKSRKYDALQPTIAPDNQAFLGFTTDLSESKDMDRNPKRKIISEFDAEYAKLNINKHGSNYKAMERDIDTNSRQYTARQMEKLCERFQSSEYAKH